MSKVVLGLIALGIAAAVLKLVVAALLVVLLVVLLLSFVTRPRETLAYVLSLGLCSLIAARPLACILTVGVIFLTSMAIGALRKPRRQPLVSDERLDRDLLG